MTTSTDEEIMMRYFLNEYSEDDLMYINRWLSESEKNKKEFFLLEMALKSDQLERYSDPDFIAKAKAELDLKINKYEKNKHKKIKFNRVLKYAAAVAIFIGIFSIVMNKSSNDMITIVADSEITEILLADGTKVLLNKEAVFKYPKEFNNKNREVILEGEAYFEVARNPDHPFIVHTEALEVRVLGTTFSLKTSKDAELASALLIEGTIEVKSNINEGLVVLSPGQKAELNKRTGQLTVTQNNIQEGVAWHENIITFETATVSDIMKKLEDLYRVKIIISPDTSKATYSGVLRNHKDIQLTLKSLSNAVPIRYTIEGTNIYISD